MKLSELFNKEKELKIKLTTGEIILKYDSGFFTKKNSALNLNNETLYIDYVIDCICRGLISEWNLLDDNDKVIKFKKDALEQVPMELLTLIFKEIQDDAVKIKKA